MKLAQFTQLVSGRVELMHQLGPVGAQLQPPMWPGNQRLRV